eukprot:g39468.t1
MLGDISSEASDEAMLWKEEEHLYKIFTMNRCPCNFIHSLGSLNDIGLRTNSCDLELQTYSCRFLPLGVHLHICQLGLLHPLLPMWLLYISETKQRLGDHFVEHPHSVCDKRQHLPVANHFNSPSHSLG